MNAHPQPQLERPIEAEGILSLVADFTANHDLSPLAKRESLYEIFRKVVTSIDALTYRLPKTASELWENRDKTKGETPFVFVRRVYKDGLGMGLTRAAFQGYDQGLYRALSNPHWIKIEKAKDNGQSYDEFLKLVPKETLATEIRIKNMLGTDGALPQEIDHLLRAIEAMHTRNRRGKPKAAL